MKLQDAIGLFADDKFKIAMLGLIAGLLVLFGVPEDKQAECLAVVGGVFAVLIAAKGYEQGKLNEGTVPDGSKSTGPTSQVNILTPGPDDLKPSSDPSPPSGGAGRTLGLAIMLFLCVGLAGCATSESFKLGMRAAGPLIADEAAAYTAGDGTLNVADAGAQAAQAERLKSETSGNCEYVEVKTAWLDVKPWYLRYVQQDQRLTDAERSIVLKTSGQVDTIIGEEAKRRRLLFLPE